MTGFALYICASHVDRSQSLFYFVPQEKNSQSSASDSTPLIYIDIIITINDPLTQPLGKDHNLKLTLAPLLIITRDMQTGRYLPDFLPFHSDLSDFGKTLTICLI